MKIDVLAFGVHPDDVELGCAGILLSEQKNGKKQNAHAHRNKKNSLGKAPVNGFSGNQVERHRHTGSEAGEQKQPAGDQHAGRPLAVEKGRMGRPMRDHRLLVERAIRRCRTDSPSRDLPPDFGPWQTA